MKRFAIRVGMMTLALIFISLFYQFTPDTSGHYSEFTIRQDKVDPGFVDASELWADSVLNSLSLNERIAQMIMIPAWTNRNSINVEEVSRMIRSHQIGGLIFFQGSPYRQAELTNRYQSLSKTPLIIAMDAEWGLGMRLDSTISYPRQMMLGAIRNESLIYDMGYQLAEQMKRLGVHVNFAPVADINNNPDNPVINSRSFGEDRANVTSKALLYMRGMQDNGVLAVAKHFPGHGDTDTDSHVDLPVILHSANRLDSLELFPFKQLINSGIAGVMTAHLSIPAYDPLNDTPSSLSRVVIDSLLKNSLGFKGLIFTDAMNMQGITSYFSPEEAVERAVLAGNDILVMPGDVAQAIRSITRLVRSGEISEEEINARCKKILLAKYWVGLADYEPVSMRNLTSELNLESYELLKRKLIESSITVVQNRGGLLPFSRLDTLSLASIAFGEPGDSAFQRSLNLYMPVNTMYINGNRSINSDYIKQGLQHANVLIVSVHSNDIRANRQYGISQDVIHTIDSLANHHRIVLNLFANPYTLSRFRNEGRFEAVVVSYENSSASQEITAQILFGARDANGMLPVSAGNYNAIFTGQEIKHTGRLKYGLPLEAGMNSDSLLLVDSIVMAAIHDQAMPGCQVLVARNGMVVLNKAYGSSIYNSRKSVKNTDLYDLASITKVGATLPVIMKLYEDGVIDIDENLSEYLPYLKNTNKNDIKIRDILMHQARLQAWIPFYYDLLEPVFADQDLFRNSADDMYALKIGPGQYVNRYTYYKEDDVSQFGSDRYPLPVARNLFIGRNYTDSIYLTIANTPLREKTEYLYSDLGFYLFKMMIDSLTGQPLDQIADHLFYRKLGAARLCFNPLTRYPLNEIVPTEDDQVFRKQLVHGYVHDPGAAMLGGVSGHAGLFSNANDLAKLFQMFLNGGEYAGERFLKEETLAQFTKGFQGVKDNRRGLGFDKPEPDTAKSGPTSWDVSLESFGHSGFTGTLVWSDPVYDLTYVFLSNRVYPDALNSKLVEQNIRTNVQEVIYHSIMDRNIPLKPIELAEDQQESSSEYQEGSDPPNEYE